MKPIGSIVALLLAIGTGVVAGRALGARSELSAGAAGTPAQASANNFPKDVYKETGNRLPAITRDALDDGGKKLFDARGQADSFGPASIWLYSTPLAEGMGSVNDFLRHKSGLDPRLMELAILVTARESDCEYVWTAHEAQGLKAGLPQGTVDAVKYRKPANGLAEKDAVVIDLGREVLAKHHVSSEVAAHALNLFGRQGVVNLVSLIGDYAAISILLNAFDQHVRPADKALLPIP